VPRVIGGPAEVQHGALAHLAVDALQIQTPDQEPRGQGES
jgi:hypothetical protein